MARGVNQQRAAQMRASSLGAMRPEITRPG
jgi:hypothetical protein